jgi:hypothetical protein
MRRIIIFLGASVAWAVVGCDGLGGSGPRETNYIPEPTVAYQVAGKKGLLEKNPVTVGKTALAQHDGHIFVNDKDFGSIKNGDQLVVDSSGKVTVNGEKREPK